MPLSFAAPWALAALAGLVAVWWLLRIRPPAPRRLRFPAIRLLFGLDDREEPPHTTPWWLLILRMALFTLVVLAAAGPRWDSEPALDGEGTLVLVVDDGWASARGWESTRRSLLQAVDAAQVRGRSVVLAGTAPGTDWFRSQAAVAAEEAARLARVLAPQPWGVDRRAFLESLVGAELAGTGEILWFWDGTDGGDPEATALLAQQLSRIGPLSLMGGPEHEAPLLLLPAPDDADGMAPELRRTHETGNEEVWVRALSLEGRVLTRVATTLADGERIARAPLGLPRELRRDVTRVEIEGQRHAGAVVLVDDRWQRRTVGLVTMGDDYAARPLLAPTYYLRRALEPFAEIRQGPLAALLEDPPSVIVLADVGQLRPEGRDALAAWLDSGGTLVRFAGERLVDANSPLLPVKLREGEMRALGGAFSWEQPFSLGPFPPESPFAGLEVPDDILIRRQMIAEPSALLDDRTMARLADGTPLVTAAQSGRGELVFFHVTANTDWSNLPLSGLFVSMLQRLVERAGVGSAAPADGSRRLRPGNGAAAGCRAGRCGTTAGRGPRARPSAWLLRPPVVPPGPQPGRQRGGCAGLSRPAPGRRGRRRAVRDDDRRPVGVAVRLGARPAPGGHRGRADRRAGLGLGADCACRAWRCGRTRRGTRARRSIGDPVRIRGDR
ncbi:MAG: BatA domain-containing protein [Alphaproteobacteria bacterium]|nr:BatA domain-containing protein [Alphaproteobacteria bacterium]